jgi:hypothetical protein
MTAHVKTCSRRIVPRAPAARPAPQAYTARPAPHAPAVRPDPQAPDARPPPQASATRPTHQVSASRPAPQASATRPTHLVSASRPASQAFAARHAQARVAGKAQTAKIKAAAKRAADRTARLQQKQYKEWQQTVYTAAYNALTDVGIIVPATPGNYAHSRWALVDNGCENCGRPLKACMCI